MTDEMTTAHDMIAALETLDPDLPLGFVTPAGAVGGGYHITEVKLAQIRSIDCGGRESDWIEAHVQVLDGTGGGWLAAGKVASILKRSLAALPELGDAPLSVELGLDNAGLMRFRPGALALQDGRALVALEAEVATCKPAAGVWGGVLGGVSTGVSDGVSDRVSSHESDRFPDRFPDRGPAEAAGCCRPNPATLATTQAPTQATTPATARCCG